MTEKSEAKKDHAALGKKYQGYKKAVEKIKEAEAKAEKKAAKAEAQD